MARARLGFVCGEAIISTLAQSLEVSASVSLANRRVLRSVTAGTGAETGAETADVEAATIGFAEL